MWMYCYSMNYSNSWATISMHSSSLLYTMYHLGSDPHFLLARFSCTIPPIVPSALKFLPMAPCWSKGPPTFWAVPPIAPVARDSACQQIFNSTARGRR